MTLLSSLCLAVCLAHTACAFRYLAVVTGYALYPLLSASDRPPPAPVPSDYDYPLVDTRALTGLRGGVALHIAVSHFFGFGMKVDLVGGASMPLFYLLSGFVMTLGAGKGGYLKREPGGGAAKAFDAGRFLRNRASRLLPMYYLTNLSSWFGLEVLMGISAPPIWHVLTWTLTNMWITPVIFYWPEIANNLNMGQPMNGVNWTIQTMFVFYLLFPLALRYLRNLERGQRRRHLSNL